MNPLPESTVNLLLSGLMGIFGGLATIPINTIFAWWLKREEQLYQHKLDMIAKQRELLLQHKFEMEKKGKDEEMENLKAAVSRLERRLSDG